MSAPTQTTSLENPFFDRARSIAVGMERWFYRSELLGGEVQASGPLVLVTNHTNGLVDVIQICKATRRPLRVLGKYKIFGMPFLGWLATGIGAIPVYRKKDGVSREANADAFRAAHDVLAAGGVISVFPEGTSHSEPQLAPLKTGAARILLGAEAANDWALGVRVQPVGIVYEARDTWRSRVAVWVGEPVEVAPWREAYEQEEWSAVQQLTERIGAALREVTVNLARSEERFVLELADELYEPHPEHRAVRVHALAEGMPWMRAHRPERARSLFARVESLGQRLGANGLAVADLDRDPSAGLWLRFCARQLLALFVGLPLLAASFIAWGLPVLCMQGVARLPPIPRDKYVTTLHLSGMLMLPLWLIAVLLSVGQLVGWLAALGVGGAMFALAHGLRAWWPRRWGALAELAVLLNRGVNRSVRSSLRGERDEIVRELEVLYRMLRRQGLLDAERQRRGA